MSQYDPAESGSEDLTFVTVDGEQLALILPVVDESMPAAAREGIARRRITTVTGRCPCGAEFTPPNRAERRRAVRKGEVLHVFIEHEHDCPAGDDRILAALTAAGWSR